MTPARIAAYLGWCLIAGAAGLLAALAIHDGDGALGWTVFLGLTATLVVVGAELTRQRGLVAYLAGAVLALIGAGAYLLYVISQAPWS